MELSSSLHVTPTSNAFVVLFIDIPAIFKTLSHDFVGLLVGFSKLLWLHCWADERETLHGVVFSSWFP